MCIVPTSIGFRSIASLALTPSCALVALHELKPHFIIGVEITSLVIGIVRLRAGIIIIIVLILLITVIIIIVIIIALPVLPVVVIIIITIIIVIILIIKAIRARRLLLELLHDPFI